jgi:hypothetical protein
VDGLVWFRRRGTAFECRTDRGDHMKMLLTVVIPHEPFNSLVRKGKAGEVLGNILETIKPEATYFTEQDGKRGGVFVIDVQTASDIPALAGAVLPQLPGRLQVSRHDEPGGLAEVRPR